MITHATLPGRLSSGLHGRIEFDFACNRGHGFGEAYLHGALMEMLAANAEPGNDRILPSHPVSAIQDTGRARGRKREVDFAVRPWSDPDMLNLCIEAKWAGSSHASPRNVLLDLIRLAIVNEEHPEAKCLFVLAGGMSDVDDLMGRSILAPNDWNKPAQLLRSTDVRPNNYYLNATSGSRAALPFALREKVEKRIPRIPDLIRTQLYEPAHPKSSDWRVLVWRVLRTRRPPTLAPSQAGVSA